MQLVIGGAGRYQVWPTVLSGSSLILRSQQRDQRSGNAWSIGGTTRNLERGEGVGQGHEDRGPGQVKESPRGHGQETEFHLMS